MTRLIPRIKLRVAMLCVRVLLRVLKWSNDDPQFRVWELEADKYDGG